MTSSTPESTTQAQHIAYLRCQLNSGELLGRQRFLLQGCEVCDPAFQLLHNEELAAESYRKVVLLATGELQFHHAPVCVLLGTPHWKLYPLRTKHRPNLYVAFTAHRARMNLCWETYKNAAKAHTAPVFCDDVVVMCWTDSITWNEQQTQTALCTWLRDGAQYTFSV